MCQKTERIAATMAYLCGAEGKWKYRTIDRDELIAELDEKLDAKILRALCRLRTILLRNLKEIEEYRSYTLGSCEDWKLWFTKSDFTFLAKSGCALNTVPKKMEDLIAEINDRIAEYAPGVVDSLFPSWVRKDYLVGLFLFPKKANKYTVKEEQRRYKKSYDRYPFQSYVYLREPASEETYLFKDDDAFLTELYLQNADAFTDHIRCQDASNSIKRDIYNFLSEAQKTVLVVDCENSDPYKIYSFLTSEGIAKHVQKIDKIILYDDVHTTNLWANLEAVVSIPVERIETRRIIPRKSVVDGTLIADVCRYFYKDNVDSFLLCSSDSDYLPVIMSLPEASFFVLTEEEKVSGLTLKEFQENEVYFANLDEFKAGDYEAFCETVLMAELRKHLPEVIGRNAKEFVEDLYLAAGLEDATAVEKEMFYKKHVRTLKLIINENGLFEVAAV